MLELIDQVRNTLPFDSADTSLCSDECSGCSKKLLEFIGMELDDWEARLAGGHVPTFGELHKLGQTCKKVYRVLQRNRQIQG